MATLHKNLKTRNSSHSGLDASRKVKKIGSKMSCDSPFKQCPVPQTMKSPFVGANGKICKIKICLTQKPDNLRCSKIV
jgi:hypothetical protein